MAGFQGGSGDIEDDGFLDVQLKDSSGSDLQGQKTMTGSVPVVISSDQSAVPVSDGGGSLTIDATSLPLPTGASTLAEQQTQTTALQLIDDIVHSNNAAFNKAAAIAGQLDDTSTTAATENNIAPVRITAQRALHSNLRDSFGNERGVQNNPVEVREKFETSILSGSVSVGTSAVEAKVGGSRLSNRRMLYIQNSGNTVIFWGPSGVTNTGSAIGGELRRRESVFIPAGDIGIYVISSASGGSVTVQEYS